MDKAIFQRRFEAATESAVTFARHYVINVLPEGRLFLIYTNQSYDGNPLKSDETLYPGDSLPAGSNSLPRGQAWGQSNIDAGQISMPGNTALIGYDYLGQMTSRKVMLTAAL